MKVLNTLHQHNPIYQLVLHRKLVGINRENYITRLDHKCMFYHLRMNIFYHLDCKHFDILQENYTTQLNFQDMYHQCINILDYSVCLKEQSIEVENLMAKSRHFVPSKEEQLIIRVDTLLQYIRPKDCPNLNFWSYCIHFLKFHLEYHHNYNLR